MTAAVEDDSDGPGENFVGDLNPESTFLAATSPQNASSSGDDDVGVWISRKVLQGLRDTPKSLSNRTSGPGFSILSGVVLSCVQQQCQQLFVAPSAYSTLCHIYEQEVHPIFPIIDLSSLNARHMSDSANAIIVQQAVCLAACTSPRAADYLFLPDSNGRATKVQSGVFASHLTSAMQMSINLGLAKDRVATIQALTVLGLFNQFSYDSDTAAETCARAVSHAQTVGLHLDRPKIRKDRGHLSRLFCCVWALDKLNAAFQGRPTLMHEHDFDRVLENVIAEQQESFQLFLRLCGYLDTVIDLYRPDKSSSTRPCPNLPSFDSLIHGCETTNIHAGLLGESARHTLYMG
jgi:hypothetical protein